MNGLISLKKIDFEASLFQSLLDRHAKYSLEKCGQNIGFGFSINRRFRNLSKNYPQRIYKKKS